MYLLITSYRSYIALIINSYFYLSFHFFIILTLIFTISYIIRPLVSVDMFRNLSVILSTVNTDSGALSSRNIWWIIAIWLWSLCPSNPYKSHISSRSLLSSTTSNDLSSFMMTKCNEVILNESVSMASRPKCINSHECHIRLSIKNAMRRPSTARDGCVSSISRRLPLKTGVRSAQTWLG